MVTTQLDIFNGHVQLASTISLPPERTHLISYASYSLVRKKYYALIQRIYLKE